VTCNDVATEPDNPAGRVGEVAGGYLRRMAEDQAQQREDPVGKPYEGRPEPSQSDELPGEQAGTETVSASDRPDLDQPMASRAAGEAMDPEAVEPYSGTEPEPGPTGPLRE
jgi:hypothetical protein